jgi:hypothetical protein
VRTPRNRRDMRPDDRRRLKFPLTVHEQDAEPTRANVSDANSCRIRFYSCHARAWAASSLRANLTSSRHGVIALSSIQYTA